MNFILKCAIVLVLVLMIMITVWAWDLHELLIKDKRAERIRIIRKDRLIKELTGLLKRLSEFLRRLMPYILIFLKWLLRLVTKIFRIIRSIWRRLVAILNEVLTNSEDKYQQILPALLLMPEENLEMPKVLEGHPYNSPVLENVYLDHYIAVSYVISAAGITRQYKDTAITELKPIIINTIRNFIASKRQIKAYVHIIAATPTYLHFAVTYTSYGWNRLLQIYPLPDGEGKQTPLPILEETIPEEDNTVEEDCENGDKEPW